jgi:predicted Zn-dependent protease with MMP-like domain
LIRLSRREFVGLVRLAYQQLPANFQKALDNVDVSVEEWPTPEELGLLTEAGTLFGLYTGVPLPERTGGDPALPDQIIIYRQPILRNCSTREEVVQEIKVTLWHEVGHYLGLSEEDLHRLGYG